MKRSILPYKLERFDVDGVARFMVTHRTSFATPITLSFYEASLSSRIDRRKGTVGTELQHLLFIYGWAEYSGFDLESKLLNGHGLHLYDIQMLGNWLESRRYKGCGLQSTYLNQIIISCRRLVLWYVRRSVKALADEPLPITIGRVVKAHKDVWEEFFFKGNDRGEGLVAPDITDIEYLRVNFLLGSGSDHSLMSGMDLRNFIMWRLAWEFGLRIGEILALRLEDLCEKDGYSYIGIVRLNHRDEGEIDPRVPYEPKVKTRSRELGYLDRESEIPKLIDIYLREHRFAEIQVNGVLTKTPFLAHNFLFIAHDSSGRPLSCSGAQKIAQKISISTGIHMNWHLIRHAFFNRRYDDAMAHENKESHLNDLVYFGGWKNHASLKSYVGRAIRDRSIRGLRAYHKNDVDEV